MAIVNYLAGSHEHFTVLIRTILVLELFSHSLDFGLSVRYTDQVSPCNAVEGVASWADFTVDLVTTTDAIVRWSQRSAETYSKEIKKKLNIRSMVVGAQGTAVWPRVGRRVKTFIGHVGRHVAVDVHVGQTSGAYDTGSDGSNLLGVLKSDAMMSELKSVFLQCCLFFWNAPQRQQAWWMQSEPECRLKRKEYQGK